MKRIIKNIIISIIGDYNFRVVLSKIKAKSVHNYEEAEWIYAYFKKYSRKGIMIDVGAHHGESLMPYLKLGWKIYAFEPDPNNYEQIPHHRRLKLYNFAISDHEDDSVSFFSSVESTGISSLSAFRNTHEEVAKVRLMTLRKIIELKQISTVDYLKIDAEGHDLFCLRGFPFEKIRPEVIVCEFENRKTQPLGYTHENLGNLLLEKGYHVLISEWEPIAEYGIKHKWRAIRKFPCKLNNDDGWGNFVALNSKDNLNNMLHLINDFVRYKS